MWQHLPAEIQGEIFGWCHVREWYLYAKTHRAGMSTFPSSAITHMNIGKRNRVLGEVAMDFHLPRLKCICMPPPTFRSKYECTYEFKVFIKAFPKVPIVTLGYIPFDAFLIYVQGNMGPIASEWFDRVHWYPVLVKDIMKPIPKINEIKAPRLLERPFELCLKWEPEFPPATQKLWIELARRATKIIFQCRPHHKVSTFFGRLLPFCVGSKISGHAVNTIFHIQGPALGEYAPMERLEPSHAQSPHIILADAKGIELYLQHEDYFKALDMRPVISLRVMGSLSADMWTVLLSRGMVETMSVYELIHIFFYHVDDAWASHMPTMIAIASQLADMALCTRVPVPDKKLMIPFSHCRSPGAKLEAVIRRITFWLDGYGASTHTGTRARELLVYFCCYREMGMSFLNSLSEYKDWACQ